ncbi:trichohyalin-like isoform X2 [Cheilinus undulatus]|uniref:trichohyalin-like isoform X2 n=1 Tax=Cheilinus undulatus TaxID=241271 RepID=UPI001BD48A0F|nr:trichohyalin-like isoform X2 [Cheilinus undulatus]
MGRKLDLSGLSDNEAEHVLQVVQRDMKLRKKEEERLSELKQELDEEGSRCLLLSRQGFFNQRCCIRCCSPFTFLLNPKRKCNDCKYNICKACRVYCKREKAWLCTSCEKSRLLKTQNLEWFYTNVKSRFKRFGSAKVLKTLYRKHLVEHSTLSELTDGSAYEESICNEGSICGSDSAFYRQSEEHSMEETLTVALRVAEEAIDEAIAKAEFDTSSQEKQNEAHYLREHKGELVEELAKTIVQKIISRRKTLADMRAEYVRDWPVEHNTDLHHHHHLHHSASDRATSSIKQQPGLFRSHSAFSLLDNDSPRLIQDQKASIKEGGGPAMTAWKSVDRLDNAVLHSMDGNWIALQSAQLSRPSLLTQRKSQVYSALERESVVVSAYEGMGSDNDIKHESDGSLGAALQEIHKKMVDSNINLQVTCDRMLSPLMNRRGSGDKILSPMMGCRGSRDSMLSDSEGNWKPNKPLLGVIKMKVPAEIRRPPSRRTSIIDINFNVEVTRQEENMGAAELEARRVEISQKKMKNEKESSALENSKTDDHQSETVTPDTLSSGGMTSPELLVLENDITGQVANQMDQELTSKLEELAGQVDDSASGEEKEAADGVRDAVNDGQREKKDDGKEDRDKEDEQPQRMEIESDEGRTDDEEKEEEEGNEEDEEERNYRLNKLITQSRLKYFSSTDDELDKVGKSEEENEGEGDKDEDMEEEHKEAREENANGFTFKLCQLEKEVRANQFSSTEDEMDRVGIEEKTGEEEDSGENVELAVKVCRLAYQTNANQFSSTEDELDSVGLVDEDVKTGEEEEGKKEELALKVCRLAHQVNASQFSSTEDELDRVGRGEEEEEGMDEEALWKLQAEKAVQAAQRRDLASLVGASEYSSTEDNLDKVGEPEQEVNAVSQSNAWETAEGNHQDKEESFEDLDVNMFDLKDEIEGVKKESNDEQVASDNVSAEEKRTEGAGEAVEVLKDTEKAEKTEKGREMEIKTVVEGKKMEEMAQSGQVTQPEAKKQEDDKMEESNSSQASWETADEERSEEYAEFDRIISSMLMMTLEDMQVPTVKDEGAENGEIVEELEQVEVKEEGKVEGESGSIQVEMGEEAASGKDSEMEHVEVKEEVKIVSEGGAKHVEVVVEVHVGGESESEPMEVVDEVKVKEESEVNHEEVVEEVKQGGESEVKPVEVKEKVKQGGDHELKHVEVVEEVKQGRESELEPVKTVEEVKQQGESEVKPVNVVEKVKQQLESELKLFKLVEKVKQQAESELKKVEVIEKVKQQRESELKKVEVIEKVKQQRESESKPVVLVEKVKPEVDGELKKVEVIEKVKQQRESESKPVVLVEKVKPEVDGELKKVEVVEKVNVEAESEFKQVGVAEKVKLWGESGFKHVEVIEKVKLGRESEPKHVDVIEKVKVKAENEVQDQTQSTNETKKMESKKEMQRPSENVRPDVKEKKEKSEYAAGNNENQLKKKDPQVLTSPAKKSTVMSIKEMLETFEAKQLCKRIGLHDDRQEDRGGKVSAVRQMMEAHGDIAEAKEKMKETEGKKAYNKAQSRRSSLDDLQTPEEIQMRYSAVQLRNITTEVLKVLNTTEELLQGVKGGEKSKSPIPSLPPNTDPKKLDQQFSKLEENVYVAAGSLYSLEAELGDLEECARSISGKTSDMELSFLEEQVATAAAKVQQSDLQICDISARIAALKNAGLNVDTQSRPPKARTIPVMPVTLDSSRQQRRRLPAPPVKDKET